MEIPPIKIAFCECCLEGREKGDFVARIVKTKKSTPVRLRVCSSCNGYSNEEFYGNLTRKLIDRILQRND